MVRIQLLGPVQIEQDGQIVRDLRSQKALGLLGYLCLQGQPVTRPYLVELFWSNMTEERGRRNLSWALSQLSRYLADCFESTRQTVQFVGSGEVWLDVQAFQGQMSQGVLATAVDLYQGELMAGLYLDDCPEFEIWLVGEREVWRQRVIQELTQLVKAEEENGRYTTAIEYTRRLLTLDPWHEESHRHLMQLLAYNGQTPFALAHYEMCRTTLEEELGVEPEPETIALFERIQRGEVQAPQPSVMAAVVPVTRPRRSHIPAAAQLFVGRRAEIKEIGERLMEASCRLLTIIGPGGIGKTRLALQVARQLESEEIFFTDGVYWVALETVKSWAEVLTAVAQALYLPEGSHDIAELESQISSYLHNKQVLLVLDNFEHLLAFNTRLVEWLYQSPQLKLLITSRTRLNVQSEWSMTLAGLEVPKLAEEHVEGFEAMQLFLHRVRQVRLGTLTEKELTAVSQICRLVEGLPLAIELAAAWTRLLPPSEIWQELEQSFDWLMTEMADMPGRHRNLNAVVAYSWNLLTAAEQEALSKLAVFSGGFRREAARTVAATSLQTLARLADQSLMRTTAVPGRFHMHTVVRHYAARQLAQRPLAQREAQLAHLHSYQAFLREREMQLQGERQRLALQEIVEELDNVRVAWGQAVAEGGTAVASHFFNDTLQTVFHVYDMQSWFREGVALFQQASDSLLGNVLEGETRLVWHKLSARQGWFHFHLGQLPRARQLLRQSLDYLAEVGAVAESLFARNYLAAVLHHSQQANAALQVAETSLELAATLGNRYAQAIAGNILAQIAYQQGRYGAAQSYGQQSLTIEREIGNRWSMGYSLVNLGNVAYAQGRYVEAQALFAESLQIRQAMNDLRGIAICLNRLGECAEAQADMVKAQQLYTESHDIFAEINSAWELTSVRKNLERVAAST